MLNGFQMLMYKVSCVAPIMIVLGVSMWLQKENRILCVCLIVFGAVLTGYALLFVKLCERKLPFIPITIENISPNDSIAIAYIMTYFVPLAGVIWKDNQWIWVVIAVVAIIVLFKVNTLSFNPIVLFMGYHCYKISLATGMADCFVISKQNRINNKNQIKVVQRVNYFLLIDKGGR